MSVDFARKEKVDKACQFWSALSHDDFRTVRPTSGALVSLVEKRYALPRATARRQVDTFLKSFRGD